MSRVPDLVDMAEVASALRKARNRYGTPSGRTARRELVWTIAKQLQRDLEAEAREKRRKGGGEDVAVLKDRSGQG